MAISPITKRILTDLQKESVFADFQINSQGHLIKKNKRDWLRLETERWTAAIFDSCTLMRFRPLLLARYDILHRWFEEKYKPTSRYKYKRCTVMGGFENDFEFGEFYSDGRNYNEEYNRLRDVIIPTSAEFIEKYSTMEGLYWHRVEPIMRGERHIPTTAPDDMLAFLTLTRIVAPENYPLFKDFVIEKYNAELNHIYVDKNGRSFCKSNPNFSEMLGPLDEILADLERLF
ncbi:MAG: hypothetical protein IIW44_03910 [Alistipes sp.]|nr:hypothetical protein [Alistipes sp.]